MAIELPFTDEQIQRFLSGEFDLSSDNTNENTSFYGDENCPADEVIARSESGKLIHGEIDEDCSFRVGLDVGESYSVDFYASSTYLATLNFDDPSRGHRRRNFHMSGGEDINLGRITFKGQEALAEENPLHSCDQDEDGISDYDDFDDDDNGIDDSEDELDDDDQGEDYDDEYEEDYEDNDEW